MFDHPKEILSFVRRSQTAVGAHDREAWLDLFAQGAVVEDPAGSAPVERGKPLPGSRPGDEIAGFYDAFIAPTSIVFDVAQDLVVGSEVVRDVTLELELSTGLRAAVPAYLRYFVAETDCGLQIVRMEAHWQLLQLNKQLTSRGWLGARTLGLMTRRMFSCRGLPAIVGFGRSMVIGIFGRGKRCVFEFVDAVNALDVKGFGNLFSPEATVEYPRGTHRSPEDFLSGPGENLRLDLSGLVSSGWCTSGVFHAHGPESTRHGVAFFTFNPRSKKIDSAQFYWND